MMTSLSAFDDGGRIMGVSAPAIYETTASARTATWGLVLTW